MWRLNRPCFAKSVVLCSRLGNASRGHGLPTRRNAPSVQNCSHILLLSYFDRPRAFYLRIRNAKELLQKRALKRQRLAEPELRIESIIDDFEKILDNSSMFLFRSYEDSRGWTVLGLQRHGLW
ncbi:hypothetical protein BS50DRAFT_157827 [Corynespora cassiicola Philippines]|uniref:Uncharacterized protein n=1 Tax=Corynespora cassiicola Philippines TaxID=1448308 RepID=A0A2T2N7A1_CORCC|nr:hypothetical protein BS50DRAFT_157827 [Corynespora cassiicola Philippines]